jgi:hypothetical protein
MREDPRPYTGPQGSFQVFLDGVSHEALEVCDLSDRDRQPSIGKVCIDPELGRLAFPAREAPGKVEVSYAYGFPAAIGGGPYPRGESFTTIAGERILRVGGYGSSFTADDHHFATLSEAHEAWQDANSLSVVAVT